MKTSLRRPLKPSRLLENVVDLHAHALKQQVSVVVENLHPDWINLIIETAAALQIKPRQPWELESFQTMIGSAMAESVSRLFDRGKVTLAHSDDTNPDKE